MFKWPLCEVAEVAAASFLLALSLEIKPDETQARRRDGAAAEQHCVLSFFKPHLGDKRVFVS